MKHSGALSDFSEIRDNELHGAFAAQLKRGKPVENNETFYTNIVKTPCSRFWVSGERAALVISKMMRGKMLPENVLPEKRRMYDEILRRVNIYMKENPDIPLYRAVEAVVWDSAPEFYMSAETARKHIRRILRHTKERRLEQ